MDKGAGYVVRTKNGKTGRTYHNQEYIKGKTPVYIEQTEGKYDFDEKAILCNPETVTITGYID